MKLKDSLIIILAVVIAIGVGVFIGFKLSENKNDNPPTNNGTTNNIENNNNGDVETEKDFSLVETEKLMSKYKIFGCGNLYITDLKNEDAKTAAAVISLTAKKTGNDIKYTLSLIVNVGKMKNMNIFSKNKITTII